MYSALTAILSGKSGTSPSRTLVRRWPPAKRALPVEANGAVWMKNAVSHLSVHPRATSDRQMHRPVVGRRRGRGNGPPQHCVGVELDLIVAGRRRLVLEHLELEQVLRRGRGCGHDRHIQHTSDIRQRPGASHTKADPCAGD